MARIFYGWWIVAAATIGVALCAPPVVFLTFGVFVLPLTETYGWDQSSIALAIAVSALALAFSTPFIGSLVVRPISSAHDIGNVSFSSGDLLMGDEIIV